MAQNFDKVWQQQTANQAAINRARTLILNTGRALPCKVTAVNGSIVTVSFEVDATPLTLPQITIPKAESNWMRMPTQVGDYGVTVPADAYLEEIAGMGGGTPDLTPPANLAGLLFVPVSNQQAPPIDQNAAQIQGPNGAIIQTTTGTTSSIVTNKNGTTLTYGNNTIVINNSEISLTAGGKTLTINSSGITLDGILWETHYHTSVTTGSGNSGPPA
jgi:hypothetical protein